MKLFDFISVKLTIGLVLGILLGYYFKISPAFSVYLFGVFLLILGLLIAYEKSRTRIVFGICALLGTIALGLVSVSLAQPGNLASHYSKLHIPENATWQLQVREVLKPTVYSDRYILDVRSVNEQRATGRLLASIPRDSVSTRLKPDDVLLFWGLIEPIAHAANPHQFAYDAYMKTLGVYDQGRLQASNYLVQNKDGATLRGMAATLRIRIIDELDKTIIEPAALGIIQAILLGQRNDIDTAIYEDYKNAGAVHILAVSGLHIGIILLILQFLFRPLERIKNGKMLSLTLVVLLLWGYAFITGLSASVVRAVTMFSFVAYALYLNRPSNIFNVLALSMFFILVINPLFLFQVGFQMSYAAVFAIVWIYPLLQRFWLPKNWVLKKGWQLLSVSVAAQAGVLPLSLYYFHQFPGLFFVTNLVVVPFLGIILGLGILVIILTISNALPSVLASVYNSIIKAMNAVIHWVAQQEDFIFSEISIDGVAVLLSYLVLLFLVLSLTQRKFRPILQLGICVIGLQLWSFYNLHKTSQKERLVILQQTANTGLLFQNGRNLTIMATDTSKVKPLITNYRIGEGIKQQHYNALESAYVMGNTSLYILDSMGIYPPNKEVPEVILLTQSPRIHMERFLDSVQPAQVIADGSNYKSFVLRWKNTCALKKIPFYATSESGSIEFSLNP
jgi:competence protein ComEC